MSTLIILAVIAIVSIVVFRMYIQQNDKKKVEGSDVGALIQLYAKDEQDAYLTGDAWKYIPPWFSDPWTPTYLIYNYHRKPLYAPTRAGRVNYYYYRPYGLKNYRSR